MTRPFCSPECRDRQGQLEHPETGLPIGWCKCRGGHGSPEAAKAAAIDGVTLSRAAQVEAAVRIIRDVAATMPVVSGNDTRALMLNAGITIKGVSGAAFNRAAALGYISPETRVQSSDPDTRSSMLLWHSNEYERTHRSAS